MGYFHTFYPGPEQVMDGVKVFKLPVVVRIAGLPAAVKIQGIKIVDVAPIFHLGFNFLLASCPALMEHKKICTYMFSGLVAALPGIYR